MSKKIKVLLVEDNEDERLFMKEGFAASGLYEIVAEAANGNEMLALFEQPGFLPPEMVITDLNMPGRNGYDVITDVRSNNAFRSIPVMVLTNAPAALYAQRCKSLGACACYTKPDTFLEYKDFANKIYSELRSGCLGQA